MAGVRRSRQTKDAVGDAVTLPMSTTVVLTDTVTTHTVTTHTVTTDGASTGPADIVVTPLEPSEGASVQAPMNPIPVDFVAEIVERWTPCPQGTPEWEAQRAYGIAMSNAATDVRLLLQEVGRLRHCMAVAGLQSFMFGLPAEDVARHMQGVQEGYVAEINRLGSERDQAVQKAQALQRVLGGVRGMVSGVW